MLRQFSPEDLSNQSSSAQLSPSASCELFSLLPSLSPFTVPSMFPQLKNLSAVSFTSVLLLFRDQERDPTLRLVTSELTLCLAGTTTHTQGLEDVISCCVRPCGTCTGSQSRALCVLGMLLQPSELHPQRDSKCIFFCLDGLCPVSHPLGPLIESWLWSFGKHDILEE